jgi:Tol biopolymer transport system component
MRLAFLAEDKRRHRQIEVLSLRTGSVTQLTKTAEGVQQFAWRPDGKALAYVTTDPAPKAIARHHDFFEITDDDYLTRSDDPPSHLWLVDANDAHARRLTSGPWSVSTSYPPSPPASPLSWSADSAHLLFGRVPNTHDGDAYRSETAVLDLRTFAVTALTGRVTSSSRSPRTRRTGSPSTATIPATSCSASTASGSGPTGRPPWSASRVEPFVEPGVPQQPAAENGEARRATLWPPLLSALPRLADPY